MPVERTIYLSGDPRHHRKIVSGEYYKVKIRGSRFELALPENTADEVIMKVWYDERIDGWWYEFYNPFERRPVMKGCFEDLYFEHNKTAEKNALILCEKCRRKKEF